MSQQPTTTQESKVPQGAAGPKQPVRLDSAYFDVTVCRNCAAPLDTPFCSQCGRAMCSSGALAMTRSIRVRLPHRIAAALLAAMLVGCASSPDVPVDAVRQTRVESNGDLVEEYRVGGLLRMVKITPSRGVPYYLIDRNGDGRFEPPQGVLRPVYFKLYSW